MAISLKRFLTPVVASALAGLTAAGLAMYVAWHHNSQCEIRCAGSIDWAYWLLIGTSWFLSVSLGVFVVIVGLTAIARPILAFSRGISKAKR